jgi:Fuc2NAc and GlcNAc transferase
MSNGLTWTALGATAFALTVAGTVGYRALAVRWGILANPNFRTLHERPTPRGGGIAFSAVFLALATFLWWTGTLDTATMQAVGLGGAVATIFGFVDDALHVRALAKLAMQGVLAAWALLCFGAKPLFDAPVLPAAAELGLSWIALVWLMNAYNFMDGVDGMAASGGGFICVAAMTALALAQGDAGLTLALGLLALCCLGFLFFNWPPASIFMGDSGSLFLGYCFGALMVRTIAADEIGLWTWLVILGYFAGDTTTTTVTRICITRNWYGAHRSHAYQNLARIWGDHRRVTVGVTLYHVLWLLPLTVVSVLVPATGPLAAALALAPVILWTLRYGPRLSSA